MERRAVFYFLSVLGTSVLIISFFFLLAGLPDWDWNPSSPLRVRAKGVDVTFQHAWHYLLPVLIVCCSSLVTGLAGSVWLVRNPAPRDAPF